MDEEQNQVLDFNQAYAGMQGLTGENGLPQETHDNQTGVTGSVSDNGEGDLIQQQSDPNMQTSESQPQESMPGTHQVDARDETIKTLMAQNQLLQNALLERQQTAQQQTVQQQPSQEQMPQEQPAEPPLPDWDPIYDDEATIAQKKRDYAIKSNEFAAAQVLKQLGPTLQYAENARVSQERAAAIQELSSIPELQGISTVQPQLDNIIAGNKYLQNMSPSEAYANAYTMLRGLEAIRQRGNQPQSVQQESPQAAQQAQQQITSGDLSAQLTPEKMMEVYRSNPQFQQLIEQERIARLQGAQQVPTHSASGGAAAAVLNVPKKPTSFDEAKASFNLFQ